MRLFLPGLTGLAVLLAIACDSTQLAVSVHCIDVADGCECDVSSAGEVAGDTLVDACNASVLPEAVCCADSTWPSSGACECLGSSCGDGGTSADTCDAGGVTTTPTCSNGQAAVASCK
ncbi:MAG TPA: hypothetical protein VIF09_07300 [Polyangiaceae bacterium]|jgi:hypothetical protein